MIKNILIIMIFLTLPFICMAEENSSLKLEIDQWLTAKPDLNAKNLYLVEFWATWCPPCRQSIPHLNELTEKFKDKPITFIGLSSEKAKTIKTFMKKQKFSYHIGIDKDAALSETLGVEGIPHAFLLDENKKVQWSGHPMELNEEIINTFLETLGKTEKKEEKEMLEIIVDKYLNTKPSLKNQKLILVEFWATWCPPCRKSIPHLNELANHYKGKPITFMGISNEKEQKILDFMKTQKFNYSVGIAEKREMATKLGVRGIPYAVLLNENREILWKGHPMELNIEKIDSFLNQ